MRPSTRADLKTGLFLSALAALPLGWIYQKYWRATAPRLKKQAEWMETCSLGQCTAIAFGALAFGVTSAALNEKPLLRIPEPEGYAERYSVETLVQHYQDVQDGREWNSGISEWELGMARVIHGLREHASPMQRIQLYALMDVASPAQRMLSNYW